jgi:hypothetical protein
MIELTQDQRQQLETGKPVDVVDSETERPYVLLRKDLFEKLRQLLDSRSEWTEEELRSLLAHSYQGNGWDEPEMDAYDRYEEELRKRCP